MALGAVQYLATARTAFEISGRADIDSHIKLSTNSRNGQFSTPSSSSNSSSSTPTRSGTLCVEVTQSFGGYGQSTHLPFPGVVATSIPSQFTQVLDGDHSVQLVSKCITPTFQSYSKYFIDMHNRDDCYTPLLKQTKDARIR